MSADESERETSNLSDRAWAIWAKTSKKSDEWLPLVIHMQDTSGVARRLWREWLPRSTKDLIVSGINANGTATWPDDLYILAENIFVFLAASHDLGKAIPAFQNKDTFNTDEEQKHERANRVKQSGLHLRDDLSDMNAIHHSLASQLILERNEFDRSLAVVLGGHHGIPPSADDLRKHTAYYNNTGFKDEDWVAVQNELLDYAIALAEIDKDLVLKLQLSVPAQVVLTGLLIVSDWIASGEGGFPYADFDSINAEQRLVHAWINLNLPPCWNVKNEWEVCDLYQKRFGSDKSPRPFQITVRDAAKKISEPSIMIVEAPMGEGKTWAALVASEILAQRFGFGGIFFALPTQATANGLFSTIKQWAGKVINYGDTASLYLAHGKSEYNEEYRDMPNIGGSNEVCEGLAVHEWLQDKRKGLLSEFAVGTVDQVLMGGLKQKYLCMRHLGLVNKVVIIDECHAYDAYMGSYLSKILNWLGAYRVPVIILSATLPPTRRRELIDAYTSKGDAKKLRQNRSDAQPWTSNAQYPLITYVDRGEIKQECSEPSNRSLEVHIVRIADEDGGVLDYIGKQSEGGGYIGIVRNTVKRAQDFAKKLTNRFPSARVCLLHAGFVSIDRVEKEASIMEALKGNRPPSAT